jgi:hypothetical protein
MLKYPHTEKELSKPKTYLKHNLSPESGTVLCVAKLDNIFIRTKIINMETAQPPFRFVKKT